jgi:hypothetical protein
MRNVLHLARLLLAMCGLHPERANGARAIGALTSLALAHFVAQSHDPRVIVPYTAATFAAYYAGNAWLLSPARRRACVRALGAEVAWSRYESTLALLFLNQGLGLGALGAIPAEPLPLSHAECIGAGVLLGWSAA